MKTEQFRANIDVDLKNAAEQILQGVGLDLSIALRILAAKIVRDGAFPADLLLSKQTVLFKDFYPDVVDGFFNRVGSEVVQYED